MKFVSIALAVVSLGFLAACGGKQGTRVSTPAPTPSKPEIPGTVTGDRSELLKNMADAVSCAHPEWKQIASPEALLNQIRIEDTIESHVLEQVDCDGHVTSTRRVPAHNLFKYLQVAPPPFDLTGHIVAVEIENQRTCATLRKPVVSESAFNDEIVISGKVLRTHAPTTQASISGAVKLVLAEGFSKRSDALLVMEGKNAIQVRYLNAAGEVVIDKDLMIDVVVHRPDAEKIERINACTESK